MFFGLPSVLLLSTVFTFRQPHKHVFHRKRITDARLRYDGPEAKGVAHLAEQCLKCPRVVVVFVDVNLQRGQSSAPVVLSQMRYDQF